MLDQQSVIAFILCYNRFNDSGLDKLQASLLIAFYLTAPPTTTPPSTTTTRRTTTMTTTTTQRSTSTTSTATTTRRPLFKDEFKSQILAGSSDMISSSDKRIGQRPLLIFNGEDEASSGKNCIRFKNNSLVKMSCDSSSELSSSNDFVSLPSGPAPPTGSLSQSITSTQTPFFSTSNNEKGISVDSTTEIETLSIPILIGSVLLSLCISILTLVKLLSLCRKHNRTVRSESSSIQGDQMEQEKIQQNHDSMQLQPIHHSHVQSVAGLNKSCLKNMDGVRPINSHVHHHQNTSLCSCSPASSPSSFASTLVTGPVSFYHNQRHQVYSQTLNPHQSRVQFNYNSLNRHENQQQQDQLEMKHLFHDHHHQDLTSLSNLTNPSMPFIPHQHSMAQEVSQDHHLNQHVLQVSFPLESDYDSHFNVFQMTLLPPTSTPTLVLPDVQQCHLFSRMNVNQETLDDDSGLDSQEHQQHFFQPIHGCSPSHGHGVQSCHDMNQHLLMANCSVSSSEVPSYSSSTANDPALFSTPV